MKCNFEGFFFPVPDLRHIPLFINIFSKLFKQPQFANMTWMLTYNSTTYSKV